jgi:valyl-tRNA synthetase
MASAAEREELASLLAELARVDAAGGAAAGDGAGPGIALPWGDSSLTLYGLDPVALKVQLVKDVASAHKEVERAEGKLANEKFTSRAPGELVDAERAKATDNARTAGELQAVLDQLG